MNRGSSSPASQGIRRACAASMRPRFMNRGSHNDFLDLARCPVRFNEAPIHESGKSWTSAAGAAA